MARQGGNMFGLFKLGERPSNEVEPTSECIVPEDAQWLQFNSLITKASELREEVLEKLEALSFEQRYFVLCKVREISVIIRSRCAVPVETLPFGAIYDLQYERAVILLREVKQLTLQFHQARDELAVLAGEYCCSMAMACLAGALAKGREQRLDYITLKYDLGQHTEKLLGSSEFA
jgi:hypothetical protein